MQNDTIFFHLIRLGIKNPLLNAAGLQIRLNGGKPLLRLIFSYLYGL